MRPRREGTPVEARVPSENEREGGASTELACHPDPTAMHLDEFSRERQPKRSPRAWCLPSWSPPAGTPGRCVRDRPSDPRAGVRHDHLYVRHSGSAGSRERGLAPRKHVPHRTARPLDFARRDHHRAPDRRELDGVSDEVQQHLLHAGASMGNESIGSMQPMRMSMDFLAAKGRVVLWTAANSSSRLAGANCNSIRPASILERSRTSLIKLSRCRPLPGYRSGTGTAPRR